MKAQSQVYCCFAVVKDRLQAPSRQSKCKQRWHGSRVYQIPRTAAGMRENWFDLCSPRPAFWISMTFFPISRMICWRHRSASTRSWHSVARYGRFCLGPLASSVGQARGAWVLTTGGKRGRAARRDNGARSPAGA